MSRDIKKERWIPVGATLEDNFDLKPGRGGRVRRCYLCGREKRTSVLFLTGKGGLDFDHRIRVSLKLLEVDVDNGQKYGFYLCDECCLLLKLFSSISRYELNPAKTSY